MRKLKISNALTGIAGVHHVVEVLSLRGMIALPTVRNTGSYDIIVFSEKKGTDHANIQVKTSFKRKFWLMPRPEKVKCGNCDFYILLRLLSREEPPGYECFMLTGKEARQQILRRWKELRSKRSRKSKSFERFPSIHVDGDYERAARGWARRWKNWKL